VLRLAEGGDPSLLPVGHILAGLPLLSIADFAAARAHLERGIALYDFDQHRSLASEHGDDPGLAALAFLATALWLVGYPDRALARIREAQALADRLAAPYCRAFALSFSGWLHVRRREAAAAEACCEALMTLAAEQGFAFLLAEGAIFRGWALAEQGRADAGIELIRRGLSAQRGGGAEMGRPSHLALLAEAHGKAGRPQEGLQVVEEALATVAETGERAYEAELHRLKGELLAQLGPRAGRKDGSDGAAEECLRHAVAVARRQGARSLELRAALSLVRLDRTGRRATQARRLLRDAYASFTEGFDTADLAEARGLLEAQPARSP
jgi:adenylate cyclase